MKVRSLSLVRLCEPMDCSPSGSAVHGILQARILEWVAISFSKYKLRILFFFFLLFFFNFIFIFKLYKIVLVLPNIEMNPPQVYMCSPSWTLPPPSPCHPSGSSQCTSPKHPVLCIEPGLATRFIHDIICVSMPFSQILRILYFFFPKIRSSMFSWVTSIFTVKIP